MAMTGLPERHRFGNAEPETFRTMQRDVAVRSGHQPGQLISRHVPFAKHGIDAVGLRDTDCARPADRIRHW